MRRLTPDRVVTVRVRRALIAAAVALSASACEDPALREIALPKPKPSPSASVAAPEVAARPPASRAAVPDPWRSNCAPPRC